MKSVHSFDVFDTCLVRRTAVPSRVFYDVAAKVFARLGMTPENSLVEDFVAARIEAERQARRATSREEITLEEIWRILCRSMGWGYDEKLSMCELESEEESLTPVSSIHSRVRAARRQQSQIVFTSDMYLPAAFVERQLSKHGIAEPGDGVYVSSEIGLTKATGSLFRHILARENVTAAQMRHIGDHPYSDFAMPRSLGIQAELFESARLTQTEACVLQMDDDAETAARMAGAMRGFRLASHPGGNAAIHELASQFAGPFVMGFAVWVLQRAQAQGVKRLYFAARDCQLICKVARELSPQFGGIECRYLYVSRQSLFLPSADAISPAGMPWMRREWERPVLKKLLAKVELNYQSVEAVLGTTAGDEGTAFVLKSEGDWSLFWKALNAEPARTHIINLIAVRRDLTRRYLEAAGLFDSIPWAVVDLGWTLTCQQALWRLLKHSEWRGKIKGYYLGLARNRVGSSEAGESEALFFQPPYDFPTGTSVSAIFARSTLLEHIIGCADHPTVHHHDKSENGAIGPVYGAAVNESTVNFSRSLHASVLDFVARNRALVKDFKDAATCRNALASLVISFFHSPTESSARALIGLSATSDQNGLNTVPIVEKLNWGATWNALFRKEAITQSRNEKEGFWLEGSMAITPAKIRRSLALAQRAANRLAPKRHIQRDVS